MAGREFRWPPVLLFFPVLIALLGAAYSGPPWLFGAAVVVLVIIPGVYLVFTDDDTRRPDDLP